MGDRGSRECWPWIEITVIRDDGRTRRRTTTSARGRDTRASGPACGREGIMFRVRGVSGSVALYAAGGWSAAALSLAAAWGRGTVGVAGWAVGSPGLPLERAVPMPGCVSEVRPRHGLLPGPCASPGTQSNGLGQNAGLRAGPTGSGLMAKYNNITFIIQCSCRSRQ